MNNMRNMSNKFFKLKTRTKPTKLVLFKYFSGISFLTWWNLAE